VQHVVREKMKHDGIYAEFISVLQVRRVNPSELLSQNVSFETILAETNSCSVNMGQYFRVSRARISNCACQTSRFPMRDWKIIRIVDDKYN
jgi:hypothetical protein